MKSRVIQDEPEWRPGNTPAAAPPLESAPARARRMSTRTGLLLGMLAAAVLIGAVLLAYAL